MSLIGKGTPDLITLGVTGNLGKDAELHYTNSKKPVLGFTVAGEGFKKDAPATWVKVSLWGERAEKLAPYLKKGKLVTLSGRAQLTSREHNGKTYTDLEVEASQLQLLGGRDETNETQSDVAGATEANTPF